MSKDCNTVQQEILYINHFRCRCGTLYSAPNPKLMYQYRKNGHLLVTYDMGNMPEGTERSIRHGPTTSIAACPACFSLEPQKQYAIELEPEELPPVAKPSIVPTPLSEF